MPRLTKKLIKQQMEWTTECFRLSLVDVFKEQLSKEERRLSYRALVEILLSRNPSCSYNRWPEAVNQAYLKHICNLPTDQIEIVIDAYNKGKCGRSAATIDVLLSELFDRCTNSETSNTHE